MDPARQQESEKLVRSWNQHDAAWLRDYLVSGVEDARINVQSVLSRHFLIENIMPAPCGELMQQEYIFAAAMNCLLALMRRMTDTEDLVAVLHALKRGSDNAEGIEIPQFLIEVFARLPAVAGKLPVPNYLEGFLSGTSIESGQTQPHQPSLNAFCNIWSETLAPLNATDGQSIAPLSVLEPACGSANDYRYLDAYGIGRFLDYTGFDLCEKNIANARTMFPAVRFEVGNAFEISAPDKAFEYCFVHDLFEHLSLEGMQVAISEICRVTRQGLCVGFFSMDEIAEHRVREVDEYHWNTLSMAAMKELFAQHGFAAQVIHIGTFLRQQVGCDFTHNPDAYTFLLRRADAKPDFRA